jgi:hypothetical protein
MKKSFNQIILFLLFVMILNSCEKNTYRVEGTLINISDRGVSGASVMLYHEGTTDIVNSTMADESGRFSMEAEEGYYDLGIAAEGYKDLKISIHLKENYLKEIIVSGAASVSGSIIDAQTGMGIDSVTVAFTTDTAVTSIENAQLIVKADFYGKYSLDSFPTGTFRMIIDTPSYFPRIIDGIQINTGTNVLSDFSLLTPPEIGTFRIILTWGFEPSDLDSHITGPDGSGGRIHVCYLNPSTDDGSVRLELDDSWRYGPETIILQNLNDGIYRYSVHNYSDQSPNGGSGIFNSPARVEIYGSEGLIGEYIAPPFIVAEGNTWRVFEINITGSVIDIHPINTYLFAEDDADLEAFKINQPKKKAN